MALTEEQILDIGSALAHSGMSDAEIDLYLEHYGVKGMKWGVRKDRRSGRRDVKNARRILKKGGPGSRAKYTSAKEGIKNKSRSNPNYAEGVVKQRRKNAKPPEEKIVKGVATAYAVTAGVAFLSTSPVAKKALSTTVKAAGKLYAQTKESEVQRFLRKNAYTYAATPGSVLIDMADAAGKLGR